MVGEALVKNLRLVGAPFQPKISESQYLISPWKFLRLKQSLCYLIVQLVLHEFLESVAILLVLLLSFGVHKARRLVQGNDVDFLQASRSQSPLILQFVAFQIELRSREKWG